MNVPAGRHPASFTVELVRPEVPLAVVVLFGSDGAVQVTNVGDVPHRVVADAMVAAAFELVDVRVPDGPPDQVYDVERDGGLD